MPLQSKPLRFLYRKYAGQVVKGSQDESCDSKEERSYKVSNLTTTIGKSESRLRRLHLLGQELSNFERIQMYFALSQDPYTCSSQAYSSDGSACTNERRPNSRGECRIKRCSPSRYRSRSQEFQSKFKLALSRSSPEHKKTTATPPNGLKKPVPHLPALQNIPKCQSRDSDVGHLSTPHDDEGEIMQIRIQERPSTMNHLRDIGRVSYQRHLGNKMADSFDDKPEVIKSASSGRPEVQKSPNPVSANKRMKEIYPRCESRSTIDADRLDSSHYQYLLDDFSSLSSSLGIRSIHSDPASTQASARAQRPSTTGTLASGRRFRDFHNSTMELTTSAGKKSRRNSSRSPESQWPPRYAIIPSWPSYEDIQTLNSCGEHRDILAKIYRRDKEQRSRKFKDRSLNFWSKDRDSMAAKNVIHVVPSHTNTECAMCNLYKQGTEKIMCPPNSPLVTYHECTDQQSRMSTNYSLAMNPVSERQSSTSINAPSSVLSKRYPQSTKERSQFRASRNTKSMERLSSSSTESGFNSRHRIPKAIFSDSTSRKNVSYTWDTCKLAYLKVV